MIALDWVFRGVLAAGGMVLAYTSWPVAKAAWQAQQSDAVATQLRLGYAVPPADLLAAIAALDRAVATDPTPGRRFQRSELLAGAALAPGLEVPEEQRTEFLRRAEADLAAALAHDPGRGVGWTRLATVRLALNGPSQQAVMPLLMSIATAPLMSPLWPARLQLILDTWPVLTPEQRVEAAAHVASIWRLSTDRRWFGKAVRSSLDELFLRYLLRNEPGAQEELTQLLAARK